MSHRIYVMSTVVAITVCMGLAALASSSEVARAQPPADSTPEGAAAAVRVRMQRARTALVQARLDQAAARLEIRASQEPAWNAFAAAVKKAVAAQPAAAARDARAGNQPQDAAALLHRLASAETARAQNLSQLADAATKLQAALDPNQREVLDQVVRTQLRHDMGRFGVPGRRVVWIRRRPGAGFAPPGQFRRFGGGGPAAPLPPPAPQAVPGAPPAPDPGAP